MLLYAYMKNLFLIEDANKGTISISHIKNKNIIDYKSKATCFDFSELKRLISFFNTVDKKFNNSKFLKLNIIFENKIQFADKLTYILLECLVYYEKIVKKRKMSLIFNQCCHNIFTEGIIDSCLNYTEDVVRYENLFNKTLTMYHYRKVVDYDEQTRKPDTVSFVMDELSQFLQNCGISKEYAQQASEISVELIDNAIEHSLSDCLVDIDVSRNPYYKGNDHSEEFVAVNIAIVNFSKKILGFDIERMIESDTNLSEQHKKLKNIKDMHTNYFSDIYTKNQFYMMSAFQNKITSRKNSVLTGGRGLTRLIERLQESSVSNICYVVSGNNCLFFIKNYISQDEEKWVGFNKENDFRLPPSTDSLKQTPLNIIGTGYNLTFVFKKENNDD